MALGPVGNAIYVNQQMATVASEKSALLNRLDLQAAAAHAVMQEDKKEIEEVRPAEENQAVDPDREHTKQEAEDEQKRTKFSKEPEEKESATPSKPLHLLDIKV